MHKMINNIQSCMKQLCALDWSTWATPVSMISCFLGGVGFAVSHHFYYRTIDDTLVGSAQRQQWPLRFGTAFAFLVQSCLAAAASTAYCQWVWRKCQQRETPISAIDAAFAAEQNAFKFLVWKLTREFQFTVMLAVMFWCMPLASLVTPGTLSITPKPSISLHDLPVNVPVFIDEEYLTDTNSSYAYSHSLSQSSSVSRIFNMLATTGELPQLDRPGALKNISYDIEVPAPLLRCRFSNDPEIAQLLDVACQDLPLNLVTSCTINRLNLRYSVNTSDATTPSWSGQIGYFGYHYPNNDNGTIFIAIAQPNASSPNTTVTYQTCHLYKAYVSTVVNITENIQSVRAASIRDTGTNVLEGEGNLLKGDYDRFHTELGSFMQGYAMEGIIHEMIGSFGNSSEAVYDYPIENSTTVDPERESPPRNDTRRQNSSSQKRNTQVRKRSWSLRSDESIFMPHPVLERTILRTATDYSNMLKWMFPHDKGDDHELAIQKKNLTTLMEELWLNASWTLMTSPDICEKVPVNITQTLWLNTYTYNPQNLFIAYGCTIIGCFLSITAGIYAIYANGRSYDNSFSSISRAMQGQGIADIFEPEKSTEKKAHRKTVARTRIKLDGKGEAQRFRTQSEAL